MTSPGNNLPRVEVTRLYKGRRVDSSSWPLYVLQLSGLLISAIVQIIQGRAPASVSTASPEWYDSYYLIAQPIGALTVLLALFAVKPLVASLQLERIGCILNFTVGASYVLAAIFTNHGPPAAGATWLVLTFALYSFYRIHEINKAFGLDLLSLLRKVRR